MWDESFRCLTWSFLGALPLFEGLLQNILHGHFQAVHWDQGETMSGVSVGEEGKSSVILNKSLPFELDARFLSIRASTLRSCPQILRTELWVSTNGWACHIQLYERHQTIRFKMSWTWFRIFFPEETRTIVVRNYAYDHKRIKNIIIKWYCDHNIALYFGIITSNGRTNGIKVLNSVMITKIKHIKKLWR